jgi:hypothetical protein
MNIYASTNFPGSMSTVYPYNDAGLISSASYLVTEQLRRPSSLAGVDDFYAYQFLKSYPRVLAGDLFTVFRKPDAAGTQIDVSAATSDHVALWMVEGRTVVRDPASLFSKTTPSPLQLPFYTKSLYIQSHDPFNARSIFGTTLTSAGTEVRLLPSNLAVVPSTTGPVSDRIDDRFRGYLNVVNNSSTPDNSLWHIMERERLAGRADHRTLDVFVEGTSTDGSYAMEEQKNPQYKPPMWPSGYPASGLKVLYVNLSNASLPNLRIHGVVHQVVFRGQSTLAAFESAGALRPVIFTLMPMGDAGPSVRDIRFEGDNNRRIVIGAKHWNAAPLDISWEGSPIESNFRWRTVLINEFHTVILNLPQGLSRRVLWYGGVMTNWTFKRRVAGGINASRLVFSRDDALPTPPTSGGYSPSAAFALILPRDAWLESYFLPVPPSP